MIELPPEACGVCLSPFEEGDELRTLPCLHHFHSSCVDRWLALKPLCPECRCSVRQ